MKLTESIRSIRDSPEQTFAEKVHSRSRSRIAASFMMDSDEPISHGSLTQKLSSQKLSALLRSSSKDKDMVDMNLGDLQCLQ